MLLKVGSDKQPLQSSAKHTLVLKETLGCDSQDVHEVSSWASGVPGSDYLVPQMKALDKSRHPARGSAKD